MKEGWSKTEYSVPASKAERDERIERRAGQYVGNGEGGVGGARERGCPT